MVTLAFAVRNNYLIPIMATIGVLLFGSIAGAGFEGTNSTQGATETPSLFDLHSGWVDQEGRQFDWRSALGQTTLLAMVYTSCQMSCPLITQEILALTRKLTATERSKVRVVLASFDPSRDTPAHLKTYAIKQKLDLKHWMLLSGSDDTARELAVALGIQYKKLQNGEFSHSNTISILNSKGQVIHQQLDLGVGKDETIAALRSTLPL